MLQLEAESVADPETCDGDPGASSSASLSKSVIGSAALLTVSGGLTRVLSMLTAPVLTSVLGPDPYGVVALAGTATALITTLSMVGVETSYTRAFFSADAGGRAAVERFCWRFVAASTAGVVAIVAIGALTGFSQRIGVPREIAPMIVVGTITANLNMLVTAAARLRSKWSRIAVASLFGGVVGSTAAIALAVWWRRDAWALVLSATLGTAVAIGLLGGAPFRNLIRPSGLTRRQRWAIFQIGLPVAITAPMYWVLGASDRWFIGLLHDERALGVYSFAFNVGNIGALLNVAIIQTWLPETGRFYEADPAGAPVAIGKLWARTFSLMAIVWLGVTAAGGDVIRLLAAPAFHEGAEYIPWIAGSILFSGLYHIANTGLMLRNELRPAAAWWVIGGAISLGMNWALVRSMGPMGAAITSTVSFGAIFAGVLWSSQRRLRLELPHLRLVLFAAFVLAAGVLLAPAWRLNPAMSLLVKLPVGAATAAIALWITTPNWLGQAARELARRRSARLQRSFSPR